MVSSRQDDTKTAILAAARRLFEAAPSGDVRLKDVAEASGYSRQAIYLHFESRSGLLVALARYVDEVENLAELAGPMWDAPTGKEALDALIHLNAIYTPRIYPVARVAVSARYRDEDLADAYDDRMKSRRRACSSVIDRLQREKALSPEWDVDSAVDVLFSLISIQLWELLVVDGEYTGTEYERHIRKLARRALLRAGPREPTPDP